MRFGELWIVSVEYDGTSVGGYARAETNLAVTRTARGSPERCLASTGQNYWPRAGGVNFDLQARCCTALVRRA